MIDPADNKEIKATAEEPKPPAGKTVLSSEEQMERFEEDLKENDWGHQPC